MTAQNTHSPISPTGQKKTMHKTVGAKITINQKLIRQKEQINNTNNQNTAIKALTITVNATEPLKALHLASHSKWRRHMKFTNAKK